MAAASSNRIAPTLPSGFRDYLPPEMIARQNMLDTIRMVFERFGFDPIETPGVERREVLTGGEDPRMILFDTQLSSARASADPGDRATLRFDLTVPLSRVVASAVSSGAIRLPFKRYQIGNVWRGERPQEGRYREFLQCDVDIVGSASPLADAEIVALAVAVFRALDVDTQVLVNNRKILNGIAAYAGFPDACTPDVLRVIDKLNKIGRDGVRRELANPPRRGDAVEEGSDFVVSESGIGLSPEVITRIDAFLDLAGSSDELLTRAADLFRGIAVAEEGIAEIRMIAAALRAMGAPEDAWRVDLSIARGLGYYTGPVFETFLRDERVRGMGSVCSGGRYDGLVGRFSDASIPATGISVGVDRLFAQLVKIGKIVSRSTRVDVLVTVMDPEAMPEYLAVTGELRNAGIRTMLWLGGERAFKAQLAYAVAQEIPVVIIQGSDERAAGTVMVKDMRQRNQMAVARSEMVDTVRRALA